MMKKLPILLLLTACWSLAEAREPQPRTVQPQTEIITADSTYELIEQLRNFSSLNEENDGQIRLYSSRARITAQALSQSPFRKKVSAAT